ncbi:MAG TPA: Maf family nucleotide pyrophosphatase [Chitinophagaceae bacterium]|nr:Maf family nucleotide pyrophosphatase [Chitinophagaceae bacterium]
MKKIILASQSPRRRQLLQWAEIPFEVIVSDADESYPASLSPFEAAAYIACNKALAVQNKITLQETNGNDYTIIGADTMVVLGNEIIGKPAGREEAVSSLLLLSGKTHSVITGVCLLSGEKKKVFFEETLVEFFILTKQQAEHYVDVYHPYDKAGAYAIQEWIGVVGIKSITGDFYNVMGLPVSRVVKELQTLG